MGSSNSFVVFISCILYTVNSDAINGVPKNNSKIIGGIPASIGQFPYQVSIQLKPSRLHFCGGSILNSKFILTAAHCFYGLPIEAQNLLVWAGGISLKNVEITGQISEVEEIFMQDYDATTKNNDVAILKLKDDLVFGDNLNKIELVQNNVEAGEECTVSGWGYTSEGGSEGASPDLLFVNIVTVDRETCQKAYDSVKFKLTENMICAGSNTIPKDACKGDSGGPLVYNGKQFGVVSFGAGCGRVKYPGVYTDVINYKDWINTIIGS